MGESFDRAFLDSIGIYRMIGDRQLALSWYRRARDFGDTRGGAAAPQVGATIA